ncbi:MAG: helix-turn-helix transcriptional regulator [Clostridiales bacterium]
MNEINIGKILTQKRKEKGITQDELGEYIGVSKASVSKWETAQSYPDITLIPKLAAYFNITIDRLMDYKPQMSKEEIAKVYFDFTVDFTQEPFDDVMNKVRARVQKYYSCFPLILQMGILTINHYELAKSENKLDIIKEAVTWFIRIKTQSENNEIRKEAEYMEAICHIILEEPQITLEILGENIPNLYDNTQLLASAYTMTGNSEKAKETLELGIFNHLLCLTQNLLGFLPFAMDNMDLFEEISKRLFAISEVFNLEKLHPSSMIGIYITSAQNYALANNTEKTLEMLEKYADLVTSDIYPLKLHGDEFFDLIDPWLNDLELGTSAPRDEKTIKASMINSVSQNPSFGALTDNKRYNKIIKKLSTLLA